MSPSPIRRSTTAAVDHVARTAMPSNAASASRTAAAAASTSMSPAEKAKWTADAQQSQATGIVVLVLVVVFLVITFSYVLVYILTHTLHPHNKIRRYFGWLPGIPKPPPSALSGDNAVVPKPPTQMLRRPIPSAIALDARRASHAPSTRRASAFGTILPPDDTPPSPAYTQFPTERDAVPYVEPPSPAYSRHDPAKVNARTPSMYSMSARR